MLPNQLRTRMSYAMDDHLLQVEQAVGQLPLSCREWAEKNAPSMKIGQTTWSIFRNLMLIPEIFDEPKRYTNVDIAQLANCAEATVATALRQLEAFNLVNRWPGPGKALKLDVPDDDLIDVHEQRLKKLWSKSPDPGPPLTFKEALPQWKAFTARFANELPLA